jgi:hypothetical protein
MNVNTFIGHSSRQHHLAEQPATVIGVLRGAPARLALGEVMSLNRAPSLIEKRSKLKTNTSYMWKNCIVPRLPQQCCCSHTSTGWCMRRCISQTQQVSLTLSHSSRALSTRHSRCKPASLPGPCLPTTPAPPQQHTTLLCPGNATDSTRVPLLNTRDSKHLSSKQLAWLHHAQPHTKLHTENTQALPASYHCGHNQTSPTPQTCTTVQKI